MEALIEMQRRRWYHKDNWRIRVNDRGDVE